MRHLTTTGVQHWVAVAMVVVFLGSLAFWFYGRDSLPSDIKLATGEKGGLYYLVGSEIARSVEARVNRSVSADITKGSIDNFDALKNGDVHLAIVQGGTVKLQEMAVVTPLFPELVVVMVRKGSGITSLAQLADKNIAIGKEGSGDHENGLKVLRHYGIEEQVKTNDSYFKDVLSNQELDGAVAVVGVSNPDLREVLTSGKFEILPIESAPGIEMVYPFARNTEIPKGLFGPQNPPQAVPTISTTAYLVAAHDAPSALVRATLEAVHEESLRLNVPTLISRQDAPDRTTTRMHPVAQRYFNPADNIGMMANVMESAAATKELLFTIGAGIFLLWHRWRRFKEQEVAEMVSLQKERLDRFLEKTLRIEAEVKSVDDPEQLQRYLEEVTSIKLAALQEFTEEELRGDQAFSIFLTQCANLMTKLQLKILSINGQV